MIDDQHKGLIELLNQMFNHAIGNEQQEYQYVEKIIEEIVNYIKNHFATEERLLSATKYASYPEHEKEHKDFIETVYRTIEEHKAGKPVFLSKFTIFLKDWILSHIAIVDKQYFEYIKRIATLKADGKLSIDAADIAAIK